MSPLLWNMNFVLLLFTFKCTVVYEKITQIYIYSHTYKVYSELHKNQLGSLRYYNFEIPDNLKHFTISQ